ncbi:hypothetical protein [Candidatus Enterococcus ikei]|uniref:Lantibiotic n=1 Tax=Candidatus Enterococcus ikei TaxID=2815326 RepID=A0ABS3GV24_9ENTE|nr:hypothetical protein [Enterococcus sp. DIV0869a]MBO0439110.1 hypothetical protein [Enterococcus sp. DIV0869a]
MTENDFDLNAQLKEEDLVAHPTASCWPSTLTSLENGQCSMASCPAAGPYTCRN